MPDVHVNLKYMRGRRAWKKDLKGNKLDGRQRSIRVHALIELHGDYCFYCGADQPSEVDHIKPRKSGGNNHFDNLALACWSCNNLKSCHDLEIFRVIFHSARLGFRLYGKEIRKLKVLGFSFPAELLKPFYFERGA